MVQSWLASLLYAVADDVAGGDGIRLLVGSTTAGLAAAGWVLTRPAVSLLGRLAAVVPFVVVGLAGWQERPYLFGLLLLALTLLVAEGVVAPKWLLPAGWAWLNIHGSWPLALVALVLLAVGRRLDGQHPDREVSALKWLAGGLALGSLNPYGPRLLVFPLELLGRQEQLRTIVEWQAPAFEDVDERAFLVLVVMAVLALRRVPTWRAALPLAVFTGAALLGARNISVAALVLLPGLAAGLHGLGSIASDLRRAVFRPALVAIVALAAVVGVARLDRPAFSLGIYPVAATAWLEDHGLDPRQHRIIAREFIGNYWELRYGADADVFIDDRIEVMPEQVVDDHLTLVRGEEGWDEVLDRYDAEAVVWPRREPLSQLLALTPEWEQVFEAGPFVVYARRSRD